MKKSRFTERQIVNILKETEAGVVLEVLSRQHGFSKATSYKWKAKYGGMAISVLKRLKELEDANRRLKQMYADLSLEHTGSTGKLGKRTSYCPGSYLPRKPAQNAYIECFNRTFRQDVLDAYLFSSLEARLLMSGWKNTTSFTVVHPKTWTDMLNKIHCSREGVQYASKAKFQCRVQGEGCAGDHQRDKECGRNMSRT